MKTSIEDIFILLIFGLLFVGTLGFILWAVVTQAFGYGQDQQRMIDEINMHCAKVKTVPNDDTINIAPEEDGK